MLLYFLFLAIPQLGNACGLIVSEKQNSSLKIMSKGLHREVNINTLIYSKSRLSNCRLLYKIEIPSFAYINRNEFKSKNYDYVFVDPISDDNAILTVFAIRKKLFSSTFELKNTFQYSIHLFPPSTGKSTTFTLKGPDVGVDCENLKTSECSVLKVPEDALLKPKFKNWLGTDKGAEEATISIFDGDRFGDFPALSLFIILFSLLWNIFYILK